MSFTAKLGNQSSLLGDVILGSPDTGSAAPTPTYGLLGASGSVLQRMVLGFATGASGTTANTSPTTGDIAVGIDIATTTASLIASDFAVGGDNWAPSGTSFPNSNDTASSADLGGIAVVGSESGGTTEAGSLSASVPASELPLGVDTGSPPVSTLPASDAGKAADLALIDAGRVNDVAVAAEAASVVDVTPPCDATSGSLQVPAQRLGPEYFLPHWTTANTDRSGVLFGLCQWGAEREVQWKAQTARAVGGRYLSSARSLEPLYEWRVNFVPPADREMVVTFQATTFSGSVQGVARRATSPFDYDTAVEPVWFQDPTSRVIRLRGLFMHTIQRTTTGSVYTICGPGTNAYLGVVPDTGYFYRRSPANVWEWVSPESDRFSPNQVSLPGNGTWLIAYGSNVDLANLQVTGSCSFSWLGGQSVTLPLVFAPVSNLFDGYGSLIGLPRLLHSIESNYSYKGRLLSLVQAPPDATLEGVIRGIGSRFNLVRKLRWDGVSPVTLDQSGTQSITAIKVVEFNKFYEIDEQLLPTPGDSVFYSTYTNWRQNAIVFVNGLPSNTYTLSGNQLTFAQPVTGSVEAIYSVQTYSPVVNRNGFITGITPGQGVVSGSYTVLITRAVNAHTVDDLDYQRTALLDSSGLPNSLFVEIAARLTENNPTSFGRARWGGSASWFEETDQKPEISRLPIPMDHNTASG